MSISLYWHDYETFGIDPQRDRPVQFAGVRTDLDFNIIEPPLVLYCQLAADSLPHPEACAITGITPQLAQKEGLCEADFIRQIHVQLSRPNTCSLGYNSIRFDDEVTRNCLYRNFYDAYGREWQNGNSRWDVLDVARAAKALRPEGIVWPMDGEGKPSFRLDQLTIANGIKHTNAHDALADVYATIAMARLIRDKQPKLYYYLWQHRTKENALKLLQLNNFQPLVHVSGKYPALKNCLAVVLPICRHPVNSNGIIVYDLSIDPTPMLVLSADDIRQRVFTAQDNLPDGVERIPLKTVHINKCPVLAPISVIRPEDAERLQIDLDVCWANLYAIKSASGLSLKLAEVFKEKGHLKGMPDPDLTIYSGGFFSDADKRQMAKINALSPEGLAETAFNFHDARLPEMLFRYRARNYPAFLSDEESQRWKGFCVNRLTQPSGNGFLTFNAFFEQLQALKNRPDANIELIDALHKYALDKMADLDLATGIR